MITVSRNCVLIVTKNLMSYYFFNEFMRLLMQIRYIINLFLAKIIDT